jgi:hypothetical protein
MLMKLIETLALLTIAVVAGSRVQRVHRLRTQARPNAKPTEVERWEGEGGGLPTGGPGAGVRIDTTLADPDLVQGLS